MRLLTTAALACGLLLAPATAARAGPIFVGGGWQAFTWDNAPGSFNNEGPLTFSFAQATKLTVTDAYIDGDRFQVFDNSTSLGLTSVPTADGTGIGDPNLTVTNPKFSSGAFLLAPGGHSITLETISIAPGFSSGAGYLRVDAASPEPASLTLLAAAGVCLSCYRWRRSRRIPRPVMAG